MEMEKMKDDIDFSSMKVSHLFVKLFVPTLLGMISSAVFLLQTEYSWEKVSEAMLLQPST